MKQWLILLLALALLLPSAGVAEDGAAAPNATQAPEQANQFAALRLKDIYGNDFDASVFDGKPVMINIWADWCGYCLEEMPALNKLAAQYADRITLVGLLLEGAVFTKDGQVEVVQNKLDAAQKVVETRGVAYPTLVPDEFLLGNMLYGANTQVSGYPTTWFVGGDGIIYHIEIGPHREEDWIKLIDAVLAYMEEQGVAAGA